MKSKMTKPPMKYKGYTGSVQFDSVDGLFYGTVQDIRDVVSYEGVTREELEKEFHRAVEDYLEEKEKP